MKNEDTNDLHLTEDDIDLISAELHDNIQLYDKTGSAANQQVLAQIEETLRRCFVGNAE